MNFHYFLLLLTVLCWSCNDETCGIPENDGLRINNIKLNSKAENYLDEMSQILDGNRDMINKNPSEYQLAVSSTEMFFELNEDNDVLYFETCYYDDVLKRNLVKCHLSSLPLSKIKSKNIGLSILTDGVMGPTGIITFNSTNSNPSFQIKSVDYRGGSPLVTQCETWDNSSISLNLDDAKKFKKALIGLLTNY